MNTGSRATGNQERENLDSEFTFLMNSFILFIKKYLHEGIFVFEQHFPFGIQNAQLPGENPASHISTGFPVFNIPKTDTGLGFITPGGNMMGNTKLSYGPFYDLQV